MTILAVLFFGILTAIVMAWEGDYSGLAKIGEIVIGIVIIGAVLVFLAATGIAGLVVIVLISFVVCIAQSLKE